MDDLLSEFLTETTESLDSLDNDLIKLEENPNDPDLLSNIFRLVHTIKGTCGFLGLPRLEAVAHSGENVLGKIRDGELEVSEQAISIVLEALDQIKEILGILEATESEPEGDDTDLITRLNAMASGEAAPPPAEAPAEEAAAEEAPAEGDIHKDADAAAAAEAMAAAAQAEGAAATADALGSLYDQLEGEEAITKTVAGDKWRIDPSLGTDITYQEFNLLGSPTGLGQFDVVFCRNVLIYFDQDTKGQVLDRISSQMFDDGALYLGGAETVLGVSDKFKPVPGQRGLYSLDPDAYSGAEQAAS